ncbi:MAG: methyltransferase [Nitrospirae bacterium]|nr:methyltransferase [Nitrospirota bacterium]
MFFGSIEKQYTMRITGGIGRGRKLKVPAGSKVRPTSDKVKQALFNILGDRVPGSVFLDLFAGAGGIGIEALSRGAERVVFVDGSRESLDVVKRNIDQAGFGIHAEAVLSKVEPFLKKRSGPYDIVFLDPPYTMEMLPLLQLVSGSGLLKPGGIVIAEHFKKQASPETAGTLALYREAKYGDTVLAFYAMNRG